ncbi:aldose 1-epimerase [Paenibacillus pasadenensis]|uniref:aldose 1-epimerase n=1 Tax=Paenibacillus pasadenensis TaxID=217090 RepID=UPI00204196BC|nr:aldose 1-epimerase [Paenibacillus pasadenensis]MCM3748400.1 aldose 1-epimerase [Paenibacillus pasadenensis]
MGASSAFEGIYQGQKAIYLRAGNYEAVMLPEIGGNMIAFRDLTTGYRFLREPSQEDMPKFKESSVVWGIPVLFPPNRFEDGRFPFQGRIYQLPVNEPERENHIHGFLFQVPWEVESFGCKGEESYVTVSVRVDEEHSAYRRFPFRYTVRLHYTLSPDGLAQQVTVRNDGQEAMPCLLAFHTTLNVPFAQGSSEKDYRMKLTVGRRWEMSERMLPTGRYLALTPQEEALKGEGVDPFWTALDNHYTVEPQNGRNRMELTDTKRGVTLVYDVGTSYKQWMIYNNGGQDFVCPEPQINLVNAPNIDLPAEEIGLFSLGPGEIWQELGRLYVKAQQH